MIRKCGCKVRNATPVSRQHAQSLCFSHFVAVCLLHSSRTVRGCQPCVFAVCCVCRESYPLQKPTPATANIDITRAVHSRSSLKCGQHQIVVSHIDFYSDHCPHHHAVNLFTHTPTLQLSEQPNTVRRAG